MDRGSYTFFESKLGIVDGRDRGRTSGAFDEADAGFDLGTHRPGWKLPCTEMLSRFVDRHARDRP